MPEQLKTVSFTETEIKIICLCCEDNSAKEIARKLSVKKRIINNYIKEIIKKMNKKNEAGLVLYAVKHGIFKLK